MSAQRIGTSSQSFCFIYFRLDFLSLALTFDEVDTLPENAPSHEVSCGRVTHKHTAHSTAYASNLDSSLLL
jgi:hypothetical protein